MTIRPLKPSEYALTEHFLYEAIFLPVGAAPLPYDVIFRPELQVYCADFGTKDSDIALAAEVKGEVVGLVWTRIMNDYGHVDDQTPSLAIALLPDYRGRGIGRALLENIFVNLKRAGFDRVSLSVQKANTIAFRLYRSCGFTILRETADEAIMIKNFG